VPRGRVLILLLKDDDCADVTGDSTRCRCHFEPRTRGRGGYSAYRRPVKGERSMNDVSRGIIASAISPHREPAGVAWFVAWAAVGVGYAFSLLAIASIGWFLLPLPVIATVLLTRHSPARRGLAGLVCGLGAPVLYVAYLNRSGPGTVCTSTPGQSCTDEWNPWPWFAVGIALVLGGAAVFLARRRPSRPTKSR
jgi:hypothetical protein